MAITKIHPIKSTLKKAIYYIMDENKTDDYILISSYKCNAITAHIQFQKTREYNQTRGTVLARHLIQSFEPGETTPEQAHQIGIELCEKVLNGEYEYVLTTHIDKGHIHNHIIFNNVNMVTGKCYQSNRITYHKIRYRSDTLCKKHNLSVIDHEYYRYKKYRTKGKSWFEYQQAKHKKSWKSKLQFDIDRTISIAKDWNDFLERMKKLDYEIKQGENVKHIAFRHKNQIRFTRAKTIGDDYTEEQLRKRIGLQIEVELKLERMIDMQNQKVKENKGYEVFATKHNLKTISETLLYLHKLGFQSIVEVKDALYQIEQTNQKLVSDIKKIEKRENELYQTMELLHSLKKYRQHYQVYKEDPNDKLFQKEYEKEINAYIDAAKEISKKYQIVPSQNDILKELELLSKKKEELLSSYEENEKKQKDLYKIQKNYKQYMDMNREQQKR